MRISPDLVRRYQETHKRKYNEDIPAKEAEKNLGDLKDLIRLVIQKRSKRHGK